MPTRLDIAAQLLNPGLIAVVRTKNRRQVLPLSEALIAGGIRAIEITMTTPDAIEALGAAAGQLGDRALLGVGTVLDADTCRAAISAGAQFVVSPIMRPVIADAAHSREKIVMLGAYTPTEAQLAFEAGADFIKIFPADTLGPGFIRALLAPLPHLRIVPTGGVDLETAPQFLEAGCVALGLGSALISAAILREENWALLTERARQFVAVATQAKKELRAL